MAVLSTFRRNVSAIRDGEWVVVGVGDSTFEILTRGPTSAYRDAFARYRREAAQQLNRRHRPGEPFATPDSLPPSVDDACTGRALADEAVLDVRGLWHDDAKTRAVTADEFKAMLRDPEQFSSLAMLAYGAVASVGERATEELKEATGNSGRLSASTLTGELHGNA